MVRTTRINPTPELNPDIATIIAQQLQNIIPHIVTQVTANVNNANGGDGNGGNNGCSYKTFTACNPKEFDGKGGVVALTRWIEKMESVFDNSGCIANQRVRYAASCFVNKALTWWSTLVQARGHEAVIDMSLNDFKALLVEEFCPSNEMEKPENAPFRMGQNQRACNECGSLDHLRYDCPKWKQATGQARNPLALEGNMNTQNNGNRARGGAFNGNAVEALQDPKVVVDRNNA
ncbi:reverse transcriptase domain-containing protein [Tanacetum coccineum]